MRILWLFFAAVLAFAGPSHAQVAAPRLNPIAAESISIFNPAVLPWSTPTRIGGAWLQGTRRSVTAGLPDPDSDLKGQFVSGQLMSDNFAGYAEYLNIDIENAVGSRAHVDAYLVGLGAQGWDLVSIGAGQGKNKSRDPATSETNTLKLLGTTLRLGELVYIGYAGGSVENTNSPIIGDVARFGAAYRTETLHAEIFREEIEPDTGGPVISRATGYNFEALWGRFLFGWEAFDSEVLTGTKEEHLDIVSLGWVSEQGLSLVLSNRLRKKADSAGPDSEDESLWVFAAGYAF